MIDVLKAKESDVEILTETQIRTFIDDNKHKPPGCSMEGPPGYNSLKWNAHWISHTDYYKISPQQYVYNITDSSFIVRYKVSDIFQENKQKRFKIFEFFKRQK